MGRVALAGVCALALGLASESFGAPYPFKGGIYQQDFEGLSWEPTGNTLYTGFGQASTGTVGWSSCTTSTAQVSANYISRKAGVMTSLMQSGAPVLSGTTPPADKSIARLYNAWGTYILLHLYNDSDQTFDGIDIGYTLEAWTKPTSNVDASLWGLRTYWHLGSFTYSDSNPIAGLSYTSGYEIETFAFTTATTPGTEVSREFHLDTQWLPGQTLILTWYMPTSLHTSNQVIGIDNVFVSVPEPSLALLAGGVVIAGLAVRRRQAR